MPNGVVVTSFGGGLLIITKNYFRFIIRTNTANPIAPITASGTMPALDVVAGLGEGVRNVAGNDCCGISASSGRVVVAVRIFVWAALIGGTALTMYTEIA